VTLHVKRGDTVQVIAGKDKGLTGKVVHAYPKTGRVMVEGVNRVTKHTRVTQTQRGANSGGIVVQEAPIDASNVMVVCPKCSKPSRVRHRADDAGKNVRICHRCGADL
jgi:large subunit ribosomal protein L24